MKPLHIMHPRAHSTMVPIPLVLYITEELMEDEGITPQRIAELLARDVEYAVKRTREERRAESLQGEGRAEKR